MIGLAAPAVAAAIYYLLAWIAAIRWHPGCGRIDSGPGAAQPLPPLSLLKPVRGRDPHFYEAIRSHATQDYPEFEILFGLSDPRDPALEDIRRLAAEFPSRQIRALIARQKAPNGKVGVLEELASEARYPWLLVNDSDILVAPGYLRAVAAALGDPRVGLVTCLYRAKAESWPSRWEAIGVATEFAPSVLVARLLGNAEFALGSTMAFRAEDLRKIGGFAALRAYLADDYQLGRRISALGYRIAFAPAVVETNLGGETWTQVWRHQLRWDRAIRVSRPAGYCGYALTQATFWALVAMLSGFWRIGLCTLLIRVGAGLWVGGGLLGDREAARYFFLIPLRDLWGFAAWFCGIFGSTVEWRGEKLRLTRDGKIAG